MRFGDRLSSLAAGPAVVPPPSVRAEARFRTAHDVRRRCCSAVNIAGADADNLRSSCHERFEEEFRGEDMPPATLYHLGDPDSGFYAEFSTPLTESVYTKSGKRKATAQRRSRFSAPQQSCRPAFAAETDVSVHHSFFFVR